MSAPDLQGPYDDFVERLNELRKIVCAMESCYRQPAAISTARPDVDLSTIGPTTSNNTNSMALVFLASSYEEFVREELSECARYLCGKYPSLPDAKRHSIRGLYWDATLKRLGRAKNILTKNQPKSPDANVLSKIRPIMEVAQLFVVNDDPSRLDPVTAVHHSNNFRPWVVDEIAKRLSINNLVARTADGTKIKTYFGVATAASAGNLLKNRLDDFYDRRNEIVHSLSSTTGYGVDYVLDWIKLFDAVAYSMKDTLGREVAAW